MNLFAHFRTSVIAVCFITGGHFLGSITAKDITPTQNNNAIEKKDIFEVRPKKTDQTSTKIIDNFLKASGGESAYANLRTLEVIGTVVEASQLKTFELIETIKGRRHLTYSWKHLGRNYKTLYAFDGVHIWKQELLPVESHPERLKGHSANHFARQCWLIQPFVIPRKASFAFRYQGKAKVSGRPAYLISGFGKNNHRSWFYFDEETFLLTRWGGKSELAGIEEYVDYRATEFTKVEDVLLPKKIDILAENSKFGTITIEKFTINQHIDPTIFYMPQNRIPTLRQVTRTSTEK